MIPFENCPIVISDQYNEIVTSNSTNTETMILKKHRNQMNQWKKLMLAQITRNNQSRNRNWRRIWTDKITQQQQTKTYKNTICCARCFDFFGSRSSSLKQNQNSWRSVALLFLCFFFFHSFIFYLSIALCVYCWKISSIDNAICSICMDSSNKTE